MNRLHHLLLLWQESALSGEELEELENALSTPVGRRLLVEDFFMTSSIMEVLQEESSAVPGEAKNILRFPPPGTHAVRSAKFFHILAYGCAACLAILFGAYLLDSFFPKQPPEVIAQLQMRRPGVVVQREEARISVAEDQPLLREDVLYVGSRGEIVIHFPDSTRIVVGAGSIVGFPGGSKNRAKVIELRTGSLIASVVKQPPDSPMVVRTPTGEVTVLGTEFQLYVKPDSTRLNVDEGAVRFQRRSDLSETIVSKGEQSIATSAPSSPLMATRVDETVFVENFEDERFLARGWYDVANPLLSEVEHAVQSGRSAEFRFGRGETIPASGEAMRRRFAPAATVRAEYWVKHSPNWTNAGPVFHTMLMTNKDGDWKGPGHTHLSVYIGMMDERPAIFIQDGENIDDRQLGQSLTEITEKRAVAGGNGDSDGYGEGTWFSFDHSAGTYSNQKLWAGETSCFGSAPGRFYKGDWHRIKVEVTLNSVSNGKAVRDGQLKYWFDDELVLDCPRVVLRTGAHPDMRFDQFLLAPFVDGGSATEQKLWLDDLRITSY